MHLRVADIEAALDLVRASVRLAAPTFGAAFIGPQRTAANRFFGTLRLVQSDKARRPDDGETNAEAHKEGQVTTIPNTMAGAQILQ
jgi:hypothetical protein